MLTGGVIFMGVGGLVGLTGNASAFHGQSVFQVRKYIENKLQTFSWFQVHLTRK